MTLECWEFFSSALLDVMSMDFAYLRLRMPIIDTIMEIFLAVGWALLIGNLVFQAIKTMLSGIGFEGEDPKLLFARTFVFSFLLLASPQICDLCLDMTSTIIDIMEVPDAVNITFADEASFGGLSAAWILVVICGVVVMFQSFKLICEMAERYLILAVLTISAPLAFGMGGSRNTSDIFTGWCRMYGSMCLMMVMQVAFIKMLLSILSFYPSGLDVLPWMILVLATVKVAKKIDAIITRIGLNPAITGDSLGRTFPGVLTYIVARSAASQVTKSIGKSVGGKGGRSPNTPPGGSGGPRSGGPSYSGRAGGAAASHSQQTSQQNAAYQNTAQQTGTQQATTAQGGTAYASTQEQTTGPAFSASTQFNQAGPTGSETRKTSVPPGARHIVSHIRSGAGKGVVPGAPGPKAPPTMSGAAVPQGTIAGGKQPPSSHGTAGTPSQDKPSAYGVASAQGAAGAAQRDGSQHSTPPATESRYTQAVGQVQRMGGVNSTVHASEQNSISVGQAASSTAVPAGSGAPGTGTPQAAGRQNGTIPSETRFTHRESIKPSAPASPAPAGMGTGSQQAGRTTQHGIAEKAVPPATGVVSPPPRPGRNGAPSHTPMPAPALVQHSPARQETVRQSPPISAGSQSAKPSTSYGTAGTARESRRAAQGSASARQSGKRAPSTPMADGGRGGKKMASSATAIQRNMTEQTHTGTDRPQRGEGNGRKR